MLVANARICQAISPHNAPKGVTEAEMQQMILPTEAAGVISIDTDTWHWSSKIMRRITFKMQRAAKVVKGKRYGRSGSGTDDYASRYLEVLRAKSKRLSSHWVISKKNAAMIFQKDGKCVFRINGLTHWDGVNTRRNHTSVSANQRCQVCVCWYFALHAWPSTRWFNQGVGWFNVNF